VLGGLRLGETDVMFAIAYVVSPRTARVFVMSTVGLGSRWTRMGFVDAFEAVACELAATMWTVLRCPVLKSVLRGAAEQSD